MVVRSVLLAFLCLIQCCWTFNKTREQTLIELFKSYDPLIPPTFNEDEPVRCIVQLYIQSIDSISDSAMEYTLFMILRQKWYDKRLIYNPIPKLRALELDPKLMNNVWVPDLYMVNEKRAAIHDITTPNKLLHIYSDGLVVYSMSNIILHYESVEVPFRFPDLFCYGYSTDRLVFRWDEVPVELAANLTLPQFTLDNIKTGVCDRTYSGISYTCINLDLHFTRKYGYHLIQEFIPSALIVMLSWVSFWISLDAVPARISLGLLSVLTMTTQSAGSRADLPEVSYIKAIDIWMSACMMFVFAALIEYALFNVLDRKHKRRGTYSRNNSTVDPEDSKEKRKHYSCLKDQEIARVVDKLSRVLFPLCFILFNIIYWSIYLIWEPVEK